MASIRYHHPGEEHQSNNDKITSSYKVSISYIVLGFAVLCAAGYTVVSLTQERIGSSHNAGQVFLPKFTALDDAQHGEDLSLDAAKDYIPYYSLASNYRNMTNRWSNVTGYTPLPNWTIDSQFAVFTNITIPKVIEFPHDHPELCQDSSEIDALVVVETAGKNKEDRDVIRNAMALPPSWRRVFLVGHPILNTVRVTTCKHGDVCKPDTKTEEKVLEEDKVYKDIIFGDFTDIYQNLTMKTSAIMKWATTRCPNAKFVFKVDDDIYQNYPVLEKVIKQWIHRNQTEDMWAGSKLWYNAIRSASHTKVSHEEFPGFHYAYYASGGRYAMSLDVARIMSAMTERIPFLPIEDVYMGLCGHFSGLQVFETGFSLPLKGFCGWGFYAVANEDSSQVLQEWRNCSMNELNSLTLR